MHISGRKVLVTGAGGFIGSHLTEYLVRSGAEVRAIVHYNSRNDWAYLEALPADVKESLDVQAIDLIDPYSVEKAVEGCSLVFHLAALIGIPYSYVAPAGYVETNIRGTLNILEAARRHNVDRLIHTSTSEVYGTAQYMPIDEDHPLQAQSPYSATKIAADKLAESYHRCFSIPVSIIRPFNTYGPRQSARAIIPTIISQLLAGADTLHLGNLSPIRDFTYVTDTVRAFVKLAESDRCIGSVCNVGTGEGISIGDLAAKVAELLNVDADIICEPERIRPEHSEVLQLVCSADRMRNLTDWKPEIALEEGLKHVITYMVENANRYKSDQYNI